jgi:predicted phage gp36 major capsid-like protein
MAAHDLTERVEVLEVKVAALEGLPERVSAVESQIVQLRDEMRGGFSAVREEMRTLNDDTRMEMRALNDDIRMEMRALNEDTKNQMRVLHEDVIERIARIGEGAPRSRRRRR